MARTIPRLRADKVRRLADDINARHAIAPPGVTTDTAALYRSLNDQALHTLRAAFTVDRDRALPGLDGRPLHLRAFCQSRIDLITRILERRGGINGQ